MVESPGMHGTLHIPKHTPAAYYIMLVISDAVPSVWQHMLEYVMYKVQM